MFNSIDNVRAVASSDTSINSPIKLKLFNFGEKHIVGFGNSKLLRILLIRPPIFADKTSCSSSDQHFRYLEAVKP